MTLHLDQWAFYSHPSHWSTPAMGALRHPSYKDWDKENMLRAYEDVK